MPVRTEDVGTTQAGHLPAAKRPCKPIGGLLQSTGRPSFITVMVCDRSPTVCCGQNRRMWPSCQDITQLAHAKWRVGGGRSAMPRQSLHNSCIADVRPLPSPPPLANLTDGSSHANGGADGRFGAATARPAMQLPPRLFSVKSMKNTVAVEWSLFGRR